MNRRHVRGFGLVWLLTVACGSHSPVVPADAAPDTRDGAVSPPQDVARPQDAPSCEAGPAPDRSPDAPCPAQPDNVCPPATRTGTPCDPNGPDFCISPERVCLCTTDGDWSCRTR
jgi:hypothetical protein